MALLPRIRVSSWPRPQLTPLLHDCTEASRSHAKTIHRLFQYQSTEDVFLRRASVAMAAMLVCEETSKIDLFLAEVAREGNEFLAGAADQLLASSLAMYGQLLSRRRLLQ